MSSITEIQENPSQSPISVLLKRGGVWSLTDNDGHYRDERWKKKERSRDNAERKMGLSCHWWHFSDFTLTDVWIRSSEDGVTVTRLAKHPELINHSTSHRYSANTRWAMSPESVLRPGLHMCCKALIRCANLTLKESWRAAMLQRKSLLYLQKHVSASACLLEMALVS